MKQQSYHQNWKHIESLLSNSLWSEPLGLTHHKLAYYTGIIYSNMSRYTRDSQDADARVLWIRNAEAEAFAANENP